MSISLPVTLLKSAKNGKLNTSYEGAYLFSILFIYMSIKHFNLPTRFIYLG